MLCFSATSGLSVGDAGMGSTAERVARGGDAGVSVFSLFDGIIIRPFYS